MIISVNKELADDFKEFATKEPDYMACIEESSLIGPNEIWEFIVNISPEMITALTAFLIAKYKYSQKEIEVKKGDIKIRLKNVDITPKSVLRMLEALEEK